MAPADARYLHVANGTSTTMTIEAAGLPGVCSIWADPLYEGPVPGGVSDDELADVRTQFLAGPRQRTSAPRDVATPSNDPINDLREWRNAIARHESWDELILWFEHDLFDQLNLVQVLTWIRDHVPAAKTVSLVCIGSFPGRPNFKGLGELTPAELAPLIDRRQPVDEAQYELASRAWDAFRKPTPEPLDDLRRGDTAALPYLAPALARFLQEYPWTSDGLSRSERRLLELASGGGVPLWQAFPRMSDGERAYYVTDETLASLAEALSSTSPALLTLDHQGADNGHALRAAARSTDTALAVLAGRQDRVETCGIDRWLGGVHLQTGSRIWRWDDARQRIT